MEFPVTERELPVRHSLLVHSANIKKMRKIIGILLCISLIGISLAGVFFFVLPTFVGIYNIGNLAGLFASVVLLFGTVLHRPLFRLLKYMGEFVNTIRNSIYIILPRNCVKLPVKST